MDSVSIKNFVLKKLQEKNYEGLSGSHLSLHFPIEEKLLNFILRNLISTSGALKDFESIVFSEMENNEFIVYVNHKKLDKTIRCRILEIYHTPYSDAVLTIEFIEGINFFEKIALKSALAFKKSLNWFKSKVQDGGDEQESATPAVHFSSSKLSVNLSEMIRQQKLDYLNPLIKWSKFSTHNNRLIIDLNIKF